MTETEPTSNSTESKPESFEVQLPQLLSDSVDLEQDSDGISRKAERKRLLKKFAEGKLEEFRNHLGFFIEIISLIKSNPTKCKVLGPTDEAKLETLLTFSTKLHNDLKLLSVILTAITPISDYNFGEFFCNGRDDQIFRFFETYNDIKEFYKLFYELMNLFEENRVSFGAFQELVELANSLKPHDNPLDTLYWLSDQIDEFYNERALLVEKIFNCTHPSHSDYKATKCLNEHVYKVQGENTYLLNNLRLRKKFKSPGEFLWLSEERSDHFDHFFPVRITFDGNSELNSRDCMMCVNENGIYFGMVLERSKKICLFKRIKFWELAKLPFNNHPLLVVRKFVCKGGKDIYGLEKYKKKSDYIKRATNGKINNYVELFFESYVISEDRIVSDSSTGNPDTDILVDNLEMTRESLLVIFGTEHEKNILDDYLKQKTCKTYQSAAEQFKLQFPEVEFTAVKMENYSEDFKKFLSAASRQTSTLSNFKKQFVIHYCHQERVKKIFKREIIYDSEGDKDTIESWDPSCILKVVFTMKPQIKIHTGYLLLYPKCLYIISDHYNKETKAYCRKIEFSFTFDVHQLEACYFRQLKIVKPPFISLDEVGMNIRTLNPENRLFYNELIITLNNKNLTSFRFIMDLEFIEYGDFHLTDITKKTSMLLMLPHRDDVNTMQFFVEQNTPETVGDFFVLPENYYCLMPYPMETDLIKFNTKKNRLEFKADIVVLDMDAVTLRTLSQEVPVYITGTSVYDSLNEAKIDGVLVITEFPHILFIEKTKRGYIQRLKYPLLDLNPPQSSSWKSLLFKQDQSARCRFLTMQEKHETRLQQCLNKIEHVVSFRLVELHMDMQTFVMTNDIDGQGNYTFIENDFLAYDFIKRLMELLRQRVEDGMKKEKYTMKKLREDFAATLENEELACVIETVREHYKRENIDQIYEDKKELGQTTSTILSHENISYDMSAFIGSFPVVETQDLEKNWQGLGNQLEVKKALAEWSNLETLDWLGRDEVIMNMGLESEPVPGGLAKLRNRCVKKWGVWRACFEGLALQYQVLYLLITGFSLLAFILGTIILSN